MLNRFTEFIATKKLAVEGDKILLAVSGGMDSVTMTDLFSRSGFEFGIAHCNFSLRGEESDADEAFVRDLARKLNRKFHTIRFKTGDFAAQNKLSIQEAARVLRYGWFNEICGKYNYDKIATAHQLNDSIETFFINLLRGSGPAGLRGIPVSNKNIIRPLLFAKRNEIEEYAETFKLVFRTDSSNEKDDYTRNKIRHHLIPLLKDLSEGFEETMRETFQEFTFLNDMINSGMDAWKKKNATTNPEGKILLPLAEIRNTKNNELFLSALLYSYGITGMDCKKIMAVDEPGKIFHGKDYLILRDREHLILDQKNNITKESIEVKSLPAEFNIGKLKVNLRPEIKTVVDLPGNDKMIQKIDAEKIHFPLELRTWQEGDFFFPLGMKGKKKISDFYTDIKLNRFEKDNTYLLLSGNDIVCILGHRIDERFKITSDTKKILSIELSRK